MFSVRDNWGELVTHLKQQPRGELSRLIFLALVSQIDCRVRSKSLAFLTDADDAA